MPEVVYAEPSIKTAKQFNISPPPPPQQKIQPKLQLSPPPIPIPQQQPVPLPPPPPPIQYHAKPHTLPQIQEKIVETAQPYRPTPQYDDRPSGGLVGSANALRATQLTTGQQFARDEALAQLGYSFGYALVGGYDALTNQYSDNEQLLFPRYDDEQTAYELGYKIVDLTKDALEKAQETIENIRRNPPQFEIPRPQLPELPQLPRFKLPELPEFKIPEFKFPQLPDWRKPILEPKISIPRIKPLPPNLTRQIREIELSACGNISFGVAVGVKFTEGYEYSEEFGSEYKVYQEQITIQELFDIHKSAIPDSDHTLESFLESSGGTGGRIPRDLGGNIGYRYLPFVEVRPFRTTSYPTYRGYGGGVDVTGIKSKTALNRILDDILINGYEPEVYKINVSNASAKDCPIGKPPTIDQPPDPPKDMSCCPDINYALIKALMKQALKENKFEIEVPIIECKLNEETALWEAKETLTRLEVFASSQEQADQIANIHKSNAEQMTELCEAKNNKDAIAAVPLSWQIRNEGQRPQLVILCGEVIKDGKTVKYGDANLPITVPHWKGSASDKISLPTYKKGSWEGIYTLNDNSKITINAQNEGECQKMLNALLPWVLPEFKKDAYFKGGKITRDIQEREVKARHGKYFATGQRNSKPDWSIDFK